MSADRKGSDMGFVHERMETLQLSVSTPDEIATGRLRGYCDVEFELAPGYFATSTPERLADKVARIGELIWDKRQQAMWRAVSEATGDDEHGEDPPASPADAAFRQARDTIVCEAATPDGMIRARTAGMSAWIIEVGSAASGLEEHAFAEAAGTVISAVFVEHHAQVRALAARARAGQL
jgi:hypothetical protein